ncbi:MAG: hypothetical protein A3E02_00930 [Candidatus Zambryskibacteria bacterium RIFCSPHIGHO2_12_FULL_38_34]|uniref:Uncharacterized protein n=1 Tax=Candidatus Zambryskibacteria bacterium RIFCSPLOWO2_12_FULL_39_16 TaxID=1802775 RepID=A0A1G2URZ2_9BACT|nr:MAG: hypothetical protein A3D37_00370 [Candidatus Zambryskibacteria bacterium RIFCSPHIGHO2_02_FULL_38_22]OHA97953.1 MAG: hypothetical protein A3E02_00930 [Candidatus Zambryskibacteria bacterium RIFCSPHIGHO2_12_FULL_38_34]OHB12194.1 MAG: hypothetical protein A3G46_00065 [Candidatus Zambryskibacteria bacterium RIFCSPLOWO2_12_FULL_39_16]
MTPYVELQESVIRWLLRIQTTEEKFLKKLLQAIREPKFELPLFLKEWEEPIRDLGFSIPRDEMWDVPKAFCEIILKQIDDNGPKLKIRNLLGFPLHNYGEPYGLKEWVSIRGSGHNLLRTKRFGQPRTLKVGDILVTGEKVLSPPREGGNGAVLVHLSGRKHGTWLSFPSRTALALLTEEDKPPRGLIEL